MDGAIGVDAPQLLSRSMGAAPGMDAIFDNASNERLRRAKLLKITALYYDTKTFSGLGRTASPP
jgi:hypothetical protein